MGCPDGQTCRKLSGLSDIWSGSLRAHARTRAPRTPRRFLAFFVRSASFPGVSLGICHSGPVAAAPLRIMKFHNFPVIADAAPAMLTAPPALHGVRVCCLARPLSGWAMLSRRQGSSRAARPPCFASAPGRWSGPLSGRAGRLRPAPGPGLRPSALLPARRPCLAVMDEGHP